MEIYVPEEDSFFLSEILKKEIPKIRNYKLLKYLELGSGSGIQLQTLSKLKILKSQIFSADINPEAVKYCKSLRFKCVKSNLFSKLKGKYDIILFNPPYLPENKFDRQKDTTGGKKGNETINKFLKQSKSHLNKDGTIFLLTSSYTRKINFLDYKKKLLAEKSLFFEKLYIWEITI